MLPIMLHAPLLFVPVSSALVEAASMLDRSEELDASLPLRVDRPAVDSPMDFAGLTPVTLALQDAEEVRVVEVAREDVTQEAVVQEDGDQRDVAQESEAAGALPESFFGVKAGVLQGAQDLADGIFYSEAVLGRYLVGHFFAIEGNVGYFTKGGDWGIPFFVNARGGVPLGSIEPYGGVGFGGLYAEGENQGLRISEVVFAGDLFLGLNLNLGKRFYVGAEAKYILTQKSDAGLNLGGLAVTGGLGLRF